MSVLILYLPEFIKLIKQKPKPNIASNTCTSISLGNEPISSLGNEVYHNSDIITESYSWTIVIVTFF